MDESYRSGVIQFADARTHIPGPAGEHAVALLKRGSLDVRLAAAPRVPPTESTPHDLLPLGVQLVDHVARRIDHPDVSLRIDSY